MSDALIHDNSTSSDQSGGESGAGRGNRKKRIRRIVLAFAAAVIVLIAAVAGGGYLFVNHMLSRIHRIPNIAALDAAHQPVMPRATRNSMTVLLTGSTVEAGTTGRISGLIALVHLNASGRRGAVVSLPPNAVVSVPGHGRKDLWRALTLGGPSLLIRTVERLTDVRIDHYSELSFAGTQQVVAALGGVTVNVPYARTTLGHTFREGVNHLSSDDVLAYVTQPNISETGRVLLQQNLIRAILDKIAHQHLFSSLTTDYRVLNAVTGALSVDSDFTNSQLESLALRLGHLSAGAGTFVSAPVIGTANVGTRSVHLNRTISGKLWYAVRHDSVAAFARQYPSTLTPGAPG
jgi:LCP family protein required for cell wall assembly